MRVWVLVAMLAVCGAPAGAQEVADPAGVPAREEAVAQAGLIAGLRARGAGLRFLGTAGGLEGWLVTPAGGEGGDGPYTLYVAPGGHAVAGLLYGPDGTLLTQAQIEGAAQGVAGARAAERAWGTGTTGAAADAPVQGTPVPGTPVSGDSFSGVAAPAARWAAAREAYGFRLGPEESAMAGLREVAVFADPLCDWSRRLVAELSEAALGGRIRLKVIPVGVLGEASRRRAVELLALGEPLQLWFGLEEAVPYERLKEDEWARVWHGQGVRRVETNNAAFAVWGAGAVPLIVWRSGDAGAEVRARVGAPGDLEAWLGGSPE